MHTLILQVIYVILSDENQWEMGVKIVKIKRVTMENIAQACGLSRNTVSKVFNNRGSVPNETRQMIFKTAQELGYPVVIHDSPRDIQTSVQNIALLTSHMPANYHFGTFFIPAFADQLSREGYVLTMCEITPEELVSCHLPGHISVENTAGILGIELFDKEYHNMLCGLDIPVLFVDTYFGIHTTPMRCDVISMENMSSSYALTSHVISSGASRLGFVGDIQHCNSFYERWLGFCAALDGAGLPLDKRLCILEQDSAQYGNSEWLFSKINQMPAMPDALICANDFLALQVMSVLKLHNISIPDDIMITGFDGTPQSTIVDPPLTTAQIPSVDIGRLAAETLLARINNPNRPFQRVYVSTPPQWRKSTAR